MSSSPPLPVTPKIGIVTPNARMALAEDGPFMTGILLSFNRKTKGWSLFMLVILGLGVRMDLSEIYSNAITVLIYLMD